MQAYEEQEVMSKSRTSIVSPEYNERSNPSKRSQDRSSQQKRKSISNPHLDIREEGSDRMDDDDLDRRPSPTNEHRSGNYHKDKVDLLLNDNKNKNKDHLFAGFKMQKENYRQDELAYDFRIGANANQRSPGLRNSLRKNDASYRIN